MEGPNTPITDADFSVSLPVALFSVNVLGSLNPSDCAGYGFTISYNCVQEPMDSCYVNGPYSFGPPEGDVYILGAASDVQADAGTVVTITVSPEKGFAGRPSSARIITTLMKK